MALPFAGPFADNCRIHRQFVHLLLVFGIGIFLLLCFQPLAVQQHS